ncbi:MAG: 1,4-alpha-glucan branching enzyme, partial [Rhodospirillales bacterium]|nr:1,4-alpha-glucan branching enzyme [Rhodospirillales bacterium]
MPLGRDDGAILAIVEARHGDPFGFLGLHEDEDGLVLRTFQPWAEHVEVLDRATGEVVADLPRVHSAGFFAGPLPSSRRRRFPYRLRAYSSGGLSHEFEDPYRFGPTLGEVDIHLLAEGSHLRSYEKLGAHPTELEGVSGVAFAVWA